MEISCFFAACHVCNPQQFISFAKGQPANIIINGCYAAAKAGHANIVSSCLKHGAKIDDILLTAAAESKGIEVFQVLPEHGWKSNHLGIWGQPILPLVVENQNLLLCLLDQGADPEQQAINTSAPLMNRTFAGAAVDAASACGSVAAVDLLIEKGANPAKRLIRGFK